MTDLTFEPFPKIPRLKRGCVITEKIDGTNAQIVFSDEGNLLVGSRKRPIYPEGSMLNPDGTPVKGTDNFGFAQWAYLHRDVLFKALGPGRHYGEWAGPGIQRHYNLDHKRFFLFNTHRHGNLPDDAVEVGLDVVPILYVGDFTSTVVDQVMYSLRGHSMINDFHLPEGVVVYMTAARSYFKVTYDGDRGKWQHKA